MAEIVIIKLIGWSEKSAFTMKGKIDRIIKKVGLQDIAVTCRPRDLGRVVESCDGKMNPRPFVLIRSTQMVYVMRILSGIQNNRELVVDVALPNAFTPSGLFFFEGMEIIKGAWREKFGIKNNASLEELDLLATELENTNVAKGESIIIEASSYQFLKISRSDSRADLSWQESWREHFKELKSYITKLVLKGKGFIFYPHDKYADGICLRVEVYNE